MKVITVGDAGLSLGERLQPTATTNEASNKKEKYLFLAWARTLVVTASLRNTLQLAIVLPAFDPRR